MEVKGWARWNGQHDDVELVVDVEDDATEDQIDEALRGAAFEASFLEYGRLEESEEPK